MALPSAATTLSPGLNSANTLGSLNDSSIANSNIQNGSQPGSTAGSNLNGNNGFISNLNNTFGMQNDYVATPTPIYTQDFSNSLQNSLQNYYNSNANQGQLAQMLQTQIAGGGPNPAQDQLNQTTSRNMANVGSQLASTKGINQAQAGRLAAMQGANMNQDAAGQAATMRSNQILGQQNSLQNLYNTQSQQGLSLQQILQGANAQQNQAINTGSLGVQGINSGVATQNAAANQKLVGSVTGGGADTATSMLGGGGGGAMDSSGEWKGGIIGMADGGQVQDETQLQTTLPPLLNAQAVNENSTAPAAPTPAPSKSSGGGGGAGIGSLIALLQQGGYVPGRAQVSGDSPKNDKVHTMLSPGEIVIPRSKAKSADKAKAFIDDLLSHHSKKEMTYGHVLQAHRRRSA